MNHELHSAAEEASWRASLPGRSGVLVARIVLSGCALALLFWGVTATTDLELVFVGMAVAMGTVGWAINPENPAAIRVDRRANAVIIECADGSFAALPRAAIARAEAVDRVTTQPNHGSTGYRRSHSHVVYLHKTDGGQLCLGDFGARKTEAESLATGLQAELDRMHELSPTGDDDRDPIERFESSRFVRVARIGSSNVSYRAPAASTSFELSWGVGGSPRTWLGWSTVLFGLALAAYGAYHARGSGAFLVFAILLLAITGLVVLNALRSLGVTLTAQVDAEALTLVRKRGDAVTKTERFPLGEIAAIDYSHDLNASAAGLYIRAAKTPDLLSAAGIGRDAGGPDALELVQAALQMARQSHYVPLGRMTLADKINVDVVLSEEIARRTGAPPGAL